MAGNQGSRAGLITTVVILTITSVVSIIFAFWFGAEKRKAEESAEAMRRQYGEIIKPIQLSGNQIAELKAIRSDPSSGFTAQTSLWDVLTSQRNQLIKTITGKDATSESSTALTIKAVETQLAAASEAVQPSGTQTPSTREDLLGAVSVLAEKVRLQAQTIADRETKLKAEQKRALDAITQKDAELAKKEQQVAQIRQETTANLTSVGQDRTRAQNVVAEIEKARAQERTNAQQALARKDTELAAKNAEIRRLEDRLRATQSRFDRIRVGVADAPLRRADGVVSSLSGEDIVYISLGQGRQIVPGMTFEVYDKNRGIPKISDPLAEDQPLGKASIEVIRVLGDNSECRVVRRSLGQQITEGDPILNVVYDPNAKYNFVVFGRFDLDRNGIATLQDTQVIRRLITQWGANVTEQITVETDFLVIGNEPQIPSFTQEELTDPVNIKKQADAQAELEQYQNVVQEARELHIPILNQNRFLAFTGQSGIVTR